MKLSHIGLIALISCTGLTNAQLNQSVSTQVSGTGETYLGCFVDNEQRDLPHCKDAGHEATKEFCWNYCRKAGFKYFGLQYSSECFCGNTYGRYGRGADNTCNMPCLGDKRTKCGGSWRNQVYTTGLASRAGEATPGMVHLGCFVDAGTRDLTIKTATGGMTVSKCYGLCKRQGYRFFGVQYGDECFCGNHYGRYGRRDTNECRMQCSGDKTTYCGAGWRNDIFSTGVEFATESTGVTLLGCFVDNEQRDLPHYKDAGHEATKEFCWNYCRKAGFKYFGLQYSSQCFCGNTYGRYGKGADNTCNMPCQGDERTKCGGNWRNQVYTTGLASRAGEATPGMVHLGCFVDAGTRDLTIKTATGGMTVSKCYGLCKRQGYRFFGVQYGDECFCGNHYGRYGRRDTNECRMQCSGDKTTYCGAGWRNDIFTTGLEEESNNFLN